MRRLQIFTALILLFTGNIFAQDSLKNNMQKLPFFSDNEKPPQYPGGMKKFQNYISNTLKYPEAAQLLGLEGKVHVSFIVERDGTLSEVKPISCLGAGCESEAVNVIANSRAWEPGKVDGKPVRVQYTVPINFSFFYGGKKAIKLSTLKKSAYGFVFNIKGETYTIDQAEAILGKTFNPADIITAEQCFDEKFYPMPQKKEVYLVIMRDKAKS